MNRLQKRGVPAGAVLQKSDDRCERDPQLKARGYFVAVASEQKSEQWPIEGFPAKFSSMPVEVGGLPGRAAPLMGEDNDYVYGDILRGLNPRKSPNFARIGSFRIPKTV